jgi:hypothetical protein
MNEGRGCLFCKNLLGCVGERKKKETGRKERKGEKVTKRKSEEEKDRKVEKEGRRERNEDRENKRGG